MRKQGHCGLTILVGSVLAVWSTSPALACYTSLLLIPTADVVAPQEYSLYLEYDGVVGDATGDTRLINTQFGVAPRVEAGVDFDISHDADAAVLLNVKWQLQPPDGRRTGVALGLCDVGPHAQAAPYVAATQEFGLTRGHCGLMHSEGETDWFAGVEQAIGEQVSAFADYTSGDANASSLGVSVQLNDRYGLVVGAMWPNADRADPEFTVQFSISGSWAKPGGGE